MSNWKVKALAITLGLSLLVPTVSFAADTIAKKGLSGKNVVTYFEGEAGPGLTSQEKVLELVTKYTPEDLAEWKSTLAERQQLMEELREKAPACPVRPRLTEEQKEKMEVLREKVKSGEMTPEELRAELGLPAADQGWADKARPELTEEQKEKMEALREKVKSGEMTPEEFRSELGLPVPDQGRADKVRPELTAEEMEKMKSMREDFKNDRVPRDGVKRYFKGLAPHKDFAGPNSLRTEFIKAVEEGDETAIKELLPQLLEQLKEGNQKLSDRLSEEE